MARSTTSEQQPSPPFYRGHRVTRHNVHQAIVYVASDTQVNTQITDAVTQASAQIVRPSSRYATDSSFTNGAGARILRLVIPPLDL